MTCGWRRQKIHKEKISKNTEIKQVYKHGNIRKKKMGAQEGRKAEENNQVKKQQKQII